MSNFESGVDMETIALVEGIKMRANTASEKVKNQVQNNYIGKIEMLGERHLSSIENDFYTLVEDPNDDCGGGNFEGWTTDDVKELYKVLYGHEI